MKDFLIQSVSITYMYVADMVQRCDDVSTIYLGLDDAEQRHVWPPAHLLASANYTHRASQGVSPQTRGYLLRVRSRNARCAQKVTLKIFRTGYSFSKWCNSHTVYWHMTCVMYMRSTIYII